MSLLDDIHAAGWSYVTRTMDGNGSPAASDGTYLDDVRYAIATYVTRTVDVDETAPTASSWATDGSVITATLSESGVLPASGTDGFTLAGTSATVASWAISGTTLTLTLSGSIDGYDSVTIAYSRAATTDDLHDAADNFLADFGATAVTNNATPVPTGEVQLIGTVTSGGNFAGQGTANSTDGDFTTTWASNSADTGWLGINAGTPVEVTRYRFAPREGSTSTDYEFRAEGSVCQGSASSTFAIGNVELDTIPTRPSLPFAPRYQLTERTVDTGVSTYQYYRLLNAGTGNFGGNFAELRWIALAGTAATARPVPPTISPWGGRFPDGSATVTLTSLTTSASIYYTLDGSTPDQTDTLYTAPFALDCSGGAVTLKAVAYDIGLSTPLSEVAVAAAFSPTGFVARADWHDERGILIEAHSGGILDNTARDGRYYWYGTSMNVTTLASDSRFGMGVMCYSSADLYNWRFEGNILPQPTGFTLAVRPHVLYNASTGKYVLWIHAYNLPPSADDRAAVATADDPEGPWTWFDESLDPDGLGYKDSTLFQDEDGTAYAVYTRGAQNGITISKLAADYLGTTGNVNDRVSVTGNTSESPALFRRGDTYFLVTSGVGNYYDSTSSFNTGYQTCATPIGTWSARTALFAVSPVGGDYNGQTSDVLKVAGKVDGFVWVADFWVEADLYTSRQVWLPLTFPTDATLEVTPAEWDLDTFEDDATSPTASAAATSAFGFGFGF